MNQKNREAVFYTVALTLVALFWGTSYAIIKDSLDVVRPLTLMTVRFGGSTLLLGLLYHRRLKTIKPADLYRGGIIGIFMFFAFLTMVTGLKYTTASKQSFLVGSFVLVVPILSWIINKRRLSPYAIVGAVMATVGIGLLTIDSSLSFNRGDLISVFCSLFFAGHMISIERFSQDTDPILLTILQFGVTSLLFIVVTGIFESYDFTSVLQAVPEISYLIVISTVLAFAVQNVAQRDISSSSTAMILTLEAAFGSLFALHYLKESMTLQMAAGAAIIFIGIVTQETEWSFLRRKKNNDDGIEETGKIEGRR